jgi:hypothetical protein
MIGWFFMVGEGETVTQVLHSVVNMAHEFGYSNTLLLVAVGIIIVWGLVGLGASMTFMGRPWLLWGIWLIICSVGPIFMALDTLHTLNLIPFGIVPALWEQCPLDYWAQLSARDGMGILGGPTPISHRFNDSLRWFGAMAHALHFCWIHVASGKETRTILYCTGDGIANTAGGASGYRPIGTGMESTQVTYHIPRTGFDLQKKCERSLIPNLFL